MTIDTNPANALPAPSGTPIWVQSWSDGMTALVKMPVLSLTAFALLFLPEAASRWISVPGAAGWRGDIAGLANAIVQGLLLAPLLIAVHRYVLLGEITRRYSFRPFRRYLRFAAYASLFEIMIAIIGHGTANSGRWVFALEVIASLVIVFAALRMLILFPAIAVEARGASIRTAMRESSGHSWRLFFTLIWVSLPMVLIVMLAGLLIANMAGPDPYGTIEALRPLSKAILWGVLWAALDLLFGAVYAAMASRLYQVFTMPRVRRSET